MSDDELPSEEQLKLRKPEKRGLRSRNPNGLSSRRDREREEGRSSRWGRSREEEKERNPMDLVRGAHMDGDRSAPQGRDYLKDYEVHLEIGRRDGAGGGQDWEDRRTREDASGRREEAGGKREDSRPGREESRSGRDNSRSGREDLRPGREESRSGRSRDEGRGGRQGSRREDKGSSSRRRSKSKEKEKERARSKEREPSPYSKALESWRKFKQAEKVALDQVLNSMCTFSKLGNFRWQTEGKSMTRDQRTTQHMVRSGAYSGRRGRTELSYYWSHEIYFLGTKSYRLKVEMQQIMISSPNGYRIGQKGWQSCLTKKFWRKPMIL